MIEMANIDLPYVEKNPSRHGRMRYYLRYEGKRICRLPDDINSEEFSRVYWRARRQAGIAEAAAPPPQKLTALTVRAESVKWLTLEYMRSAAFRRLDATTQQRRRNILEALWETPLDPRDPAGNRYGDMPMAKLDRANIEILRDRKRDVPFAADELLKVLRQVMDTKNTEGKPYVANEARLVSPFKMHTDGHHTATEAEITAYLTHHSANPMALFTMALMMYTGLRVSDIAVVGPQHRRGNVIRMRLFKNRNRHPVDIEIVLHPVLERMLDEHKPIAMTYVTSEFGKPFSVKGLGNRISDWFRQAGLPHCTSHSVRKGLATNVAYGEATDSMLNAMFGWTGHRTSKIYTAKAEKARLSASAVARISWGTEAEKLLVAGGAK